MNSELSPEDRKLRQTIAWPLTCANNYPDHVAPHVLGADMSPIINAVFNALKDAGYTKSEPPAESLPLGTRVRVTAAFLTYSGYEGVVVRTPYTTLANYPIRVEFESGVTEVFKLDELEVLPPLTTKDA